MKDLRIINLIKNKDLDKAKWDEHLSMTYNKLIYAESVYLDHLCPGWSALINDDWQSMMPFPVKKKMGISYAFQPPFIQQLGVFCNPDIGFNMDAYIEKAIIHAPLIDMNFNYAIGLPIGQKRCNYVLELWHPFDDLKRKFRKDLVTKAEANHLIYEEGDIDETMKAYIDEIISKTRNLSLSSVFQFRNLCQHYDSLGRVICRKIVSQKNETLGYGLFLKDNRRIYYMISATRKKGRSIDANAFLLHEVIREFSGRPLLFDFEGSEIPGVKFFFEKFSPKSQPYTRVQINRLNPIQNVIKSIRDIIR